MQSDPRTSANLLVILVKTLVSLLVKLTESGQGGHRGRGSRDRQTQGGHVPRCVAPRQLIWGAQGPRAGTPGVGEKEKQRLPLYDFHRFLRLSWDEYWESRQVILLLR